ncbi:MAG TPA: glycosyltransferase family 87 protein, partial [Candidatus Binataceae bacterium]|nr:glycosyltransferase family 87 protein [Candidatus Binataceae bacterium]
MSPTWRWLRDAPWLTPKRLRVYPLMILGVYVALETAWLALSHGLIDRNGTPLGADFVAMWTAGRLALHGVPVAAYDQARLLIAQRAALADPKLALCAFFYPPIYLLTALPFAALPYLGALLVWTALGLGVYLVVIRRVVPRPETLLLALAFPGALVNLTNGQNGFFTAALLGAGLLSLAERPFTAGLLFGLLATKPQLA